LIPAGGPDQDGGALRYRTPLSSFSCQIMIHNVDIAYFLELGALG